MFIPTKNDSLTILSVLVECHTKVWVDLWITVFELKLIKRQYHVLVHIFGDMSIDLPSHPCLLYYQISVGEFGRYPPIFDFLEEKK